MIIEDQEPPEEVTLFSCGLLSKWGFCDGDLLEWMYEISRDVDCHAVLVECVERHLLPALKQKVDIAVIGTCHNPIRATHIDGVELPDDAWFDTEFGEGILTPEFVTITGKQVMEIQEELNPTARGDAL